MITRSPEYTNYFLNKYTIEHNTGLVYLNEDVVIGVLEYKILNKTDVEIINLVIKDGVNLLSFIEEIFYWNPYIKNAIWDNRKNPICLDRLRKTGFNKENDLYIFKNPNPLILYKYNIKDIKIAQLSVSSEKVERVGEWIESPEDIIVNLYKIDDNIICIDGNSRLVAGYNKDIDEIYGFITEDGYDELYRENIKWCENEGVFNIEDLAKRVVNSEEHKRIWIDRCQEFIANDN